MNLSNIALEIVNRIDFVLTAIIFVYGVLFVLIINNKPSHKFASARNRDFSTCTRKNVPFIILTLLLATSVYLIYTKSNPLVHAKNERNYQNTTNSDNTSEIVPNLIKIEEKNIPANKPLKLKIENTAIPNENLEFIVKNKRTNQTLETIANIDETTNEVKINPTREFKPGKFEITVIKKQNATAQNTDTQQTTKNKITKSITEAVEKLTNNDETSQENSSVVYRQDFLWGVLAFNSDKAQYKPYQTANMQIGVLNEKGDIVCDATVTLEITNTTTNKTTKLSTLNGKIIRSEECKKHNYTLEPDYKTSMQLVDTGKYDVKITAATENGTYTTTDSFEVLDDIQFEVQRDTITRVYPKKAYPITITVIPSEDFTGKIIETVPKSFQIRHSFVGKTYNDIQETETEKKLIWNVKLQKDEPVTLSYMFDAPDISPQFYLLGPLEFVTETKTTEIVDSTQTDKEIATLKDKATRWLGLDAELKAELSNSSNSQTLNQKQPTNKVLEDETVFLDDTTQDDSPAPTVQTNKQVVFTEKREWQLANDAIGDYAIYVDTNGTHDTNNTTYTGVPFNNQVAQSSIFTQDSNDIDVSLGSAGRYLFGYLVQARNDSYDSRISYLSRVTLDGIEDLTGHGQGYRRNAANDRYYAYGYGIVNTNINDAIRVEVIRQGTNDTSHILEANRSSFWLLKLDDSWAYLKLQGQDNQSTSTSKQNINFTTSIENTDTNVFGHSTSTNSDQITLKSAGHYLVVYSVGVDSATERTTITTNLTLNGTAIPQSYDYSYIRYLNGTSHGTATNMSVISASANDILRLEWGATGAYSANSTQTRSDRTFIAIAKLPDTGDYLITHDTSGTQDIGGLNNTLTFDTSDEADSSSFSFNTSTGTTTIQQDGTYLFMSGARTNRTSGTARLTSAGRFYVNGTAQTVGSTGVYVRGDQGTYDTFDGGWTAAGIFSLSSSDTVTFRQVDEGDNGGDDKFVANSMGLTAINLDTILMPETNNNPNAPQTPYVNNNTAQSGQPSPVSNLTDTTPAFSAIYDDDDTSDKAVFYQIQVGDDTNWSDTPELWDSGKTALSTIVDENSRSEDIIYNGSGLFGGNTYYWRIKFWDDKGGEGAWSTTQQFSMATNNNPNAPQTPFCNNDTAQSGRASPVYGLTDTTPAFSAIYDDDDLSDTAEYYQLQVGDDTDWSDTPELWDSNKTALSSSCSENTRCEDITYNGTALTLGSTYYWRIKFWDNRGGEGTWSATQQFSLASSVGEDGDIAIYKDTNGTHNVNNTSYTGVPFNFTLRQDPTFSQNTNKIDVKVANSGHYLLGYYTEALNDTYTDRIQILSRILVGGTENLAAHGQAYRRDANNDRLYAYGYGIVSASANDNVRLEIIRNNNNSSSHLLVPDKSSFWLVKLTDSWAYLRLQGQDNQSTSTSKQNINFTTSLENSDTNTFGHSTTTNPDQITLKTAGHYLVTYNVGVDGATERTSITSDLTLNGTPIPQSYDYSYIRYYAGTTHGTTSNMVIINANANDILRLEWGATGAYSANGTQTRSDRTGIQIVKLPDTADYLRAYETTDGQDIGGLNNTITFDTNSESDTNSFTYSTSTSQTTINKSGDYIFTAGARTNRTTGSTRLMSKGTFFVNGSDAELASTGTYVRGDQGTYDTFDGGWSAGGILSLYDTDTVDFRQIDQGDNGGDDVFVSSSYGITALNLGSIYTFSISGTCKQYDKTTNCSDGETVKVAIDGALQSQTTTTSSGTFTISNIPKPTKNSVITVFVDNVADANEAVTVTKYTGSGDISNLELYEEHITIGDPNNTQPITNKDLAKYDNSTSGDEDIFFDVDTNNNLTTDYTNQSTKEKIYILASNSYRPDQDNTTTVNATYVEIDGGLILDDTTLILNGSGTGSGVPITLGTNGVFTSGTTSTVEFKGTSNTEIPPLTYYNLKITPPSGSPTYTFGTATSQTIDINGSLTIGDTTNTVTATVETYSPAININKSLIVNSSATLSGSYSNTIKTSGSVTGGGVINLSGTGVFQNNASANVSFGTSTGSNNWTFSNLKFSNSAFTPVTISLNSGGTGTIIVTDIVTIGDSSDDESTTLDNETNDRNLDLVNLLITDMGEFSASSTSTQTISKNFTNNGTFTPNNSTIEFDDATQTSQLLYSSDTTFYNLKVATSGKQIQFDETDQTNISGTLTLQGTDCSTGRILVDSTTNNNQFDINATGDTTIEYVDIEDSNAITALTARNATEDNGGNTNWTIIAGSCGSNTPPNDPTALSQSKTDDTTLAVGDFTNETAVKFSASASDTDNPEGLKLCVEVQPVSTAFTGTPTQCSDEQTYTGTAITIELTVSGLSTDTSYHWQARITDTANTNSNWVSFGGNAETSRDFGVDTSAPTTATVYDGSTTGVDKDISSTSLSQLEANWDNFDATISGLEKYEYSIGLTPGATDVQAWTDNGTNTSVTVTGLTLQTSKVYYFNVRATDKAGNVSSVSSSDGQIVAPSLQFSVTPSSVEFSNLNAANNYTSTQTATLTTSTNAYNGYEVRAYITQLLTSSDGTNTIQNFDGGTYSAPASWDPENRGFGYTSSDTSIQGTDKFNSTSCAGGGTAPCYAPFSTSRPGDIVADHESTVSGSSITDEQFDITYKVQTDSTQPASTYSTVVVYTVTAKY